MSNQNACVCILKTNQPKNEPAYEYRVRYFPYGAPAWTDYAYTHPRDALPHARNDFGQQVVAADYETAWMLAQGIVRHDDIMIVDLPAQF